MSPDAIVRVEQPQLPLARELLEQADIYAGAALSPNTRRAYRRDWEVFVAWCSQNGRNALPADPQTVVAYLASLAEQKKPDGTPKFRVASIERALTSISTAHDVAGFLASRKNKLVSKTMSGIAKTFGEPQTQKAPLRPNMLGDMLLHLPPGLLGMRDRALLLVGFCGGFRRSELVALDVKDLAFVEDGLQVMIRRSKTDQRGKGRKIGLPMGSTALRCPVRSTKAWLDAVSLTEGPVFRAVSRHGKLSQDRLSPQTVALVVKRYAKAAKINEKSVSGHSLRAGLVTSAYKAHKTHDAIMAQTGHLSFEMVRRYIRDASLFEDNAAAGLL
jgi:site-specific recombinase XerD